MKTRPSPPPGRVRPMVLGLALGLLAACGATPQERFYTLSAAAAAPAGAMPAAAAIFVGPVAVPDAVDRLPMVLTTGPNQVEIADLHRWAEPLEAAIPRVVAENLRRELGAANVAWSRHASGGTYAQRVAIEVQRFESSVADGATLDAIWTVTPAKGAARTGRSVIREPASSADPAGIAAAHSRALARLAADIAPALK